MRDNLAWTQFVATAGQLRWSEADNGAAFEKAQKKLGLETYSAMQLGGDLFVARGKRDEVHARPRPKVWKAADQQLLCAGDLDGDGRTEYIMGGGWFGPFGGFICIYNDAMQKVAEAELDNVFALKLDDLLGDGSRQILCWQDHHNGTDGWRRSLTVFRFSESRLTPLWNGLTYSYSNAGGFDITKRKIRIRRARGKPAVIEVEEIYRRGTHEDTDNGTSYSYLETPYTVTRFIWNPVSERFEAGDERRKSR